MNNRRHIQAKVATALLLLCFMVCGSASAQNTTNLPTSMYGVGELAPSEGGRYAGMGNVGIALNRTGFQNTLNPACITHMDTLCFTFDIGGTAAFSRYKFLSDQSNNLTGNPNKFSLGFRALRKWYIVFGAAPYSSVGYLIYTTNEIEGSVGSYIYSSFTGEGGLTRFYATNAYALSKNLSVGLSLGAVVGKTTQSETQESAIVSYTSKQKAFYGDIGIHYQATDRGGRTWNIGVVYSPSVKIYRSNDLTYYNSSTSETIERQYHIPKQYLPQHIGGGLAMATRRWVITADYNYVDWSKNSSSYTSMKYMNQHKANLGAIYITQPRQPRSLEYMAGIGYSNSYINLKNGKMYYLEASCGASFPIRYSFVAVGATWRRLVNSRKGMMQENRLSLSVNVTFGERISKSRLR